MKTDNLHAAATRVSVLFNTQYLRPHADGGRAKHAFQQLNDALADTTREKALIDALTTAEHGFHLLAHNISLHMPGSPLIQWAKDGEAAALAAITKATQ